MIDSVVPGSVVSVTVVLMANSTTDQEAVLSVAQSGLAHQVAQLAVSLADSGAERPGEVELSAHCGDVATD